MGCDIHLVVEKQVAPDKWVCIDTMLGHHFQPHTKDQYDWASPIAESRNYERFAALAGVRGGGPKPRGLPNNISETTAYLVDDIAEDGHSHSWLSMSEAIKVWKATHHWPKPEDGKEPFGKKYPASYFFGVEDGDVGKYRVVFWFDN